MAGHTPEPIDIEAALRGQSAVLAAKDAVYRLVRSGAPDAGDRLRGLVREGATVAIRRRAALALSLVPEARLALLDALAVEEPAVLTAVLLSLARVGVAEDLTSMRTAAKRLSGREAEQARFAELLLAHRLHLGPEIVPAMPTPPARELPTRTKPVTSGSAEEIARALAGFVANAHLGFEPDRRRCALIHCARRDILVIPSMERAHGDLQRLLHDRALVGATAAYEREAASWFHDLWIFSTPSKGGVDLQAWTQGGRACYTGPGRLEGDALVFELRTTESSGLALASVRGRFTSDGLEVEGTVGDRDPSDPRGPVLRRRD